MKVLGMAKNYPLTPTKDIVPEELLFPNEHGHYDERVKIDAFTQHPEVGGSGRVLSQHSQDLTVQLTDTEKGDFKHDNTKD